MSRARFSVRHLAALGGLLVAAGAVCVVLWAEYAAPAIRRAARTHAVPAQANTTPATIQRGAYLARLGNCAQCHTSRGGPAYGGGAPLTTPFGTVYSSNLTPDPATGLGRWTQEDFWRALHHGERPDGTVLNPAFPYTSFTRVERADADALFAYLQTLPPVTAPAPAHQLRWPLGSQTALNAWRLLHFSPADTATSTLSPEAAPSAPSARQGAYLVQGLGHCAECHTPRDALGGLRNSLAWSGAVLPDGQWYAPALNDAREAGLSAWATEDIASLLTRGQHGTAFVSGPMAEVVRNSTQHLSPDDARSVALYLQTLNNGATASSASEARTSSPAYPAGARIYDNQCAQCHGKQGEGQADAYPALAGNRAVRMANTNNLVLAVLHGGYGPSTPAKPQPFGMPPYQLTLSDADLASVLSHIRSSWGNQAAPVTEFDINKIRNAPTR